VGDRQEELSVEDQPEDKCEEKEHESEKGKTNEDGGLFVGFPGFFHSIISFQEKGNAAASRKTQATPPA
jgi:hypothetical protein